MSSEKRQRTDEELIIYTLLDIRPFVRNNTVWLGYDLRFHTSDANGQVQWDNRNQDLFERIVIKTKEFISWEISRMYENINVADFDIDIMDEEDQEAENFFAFITYSFLSIADINVITIQSIEYIQRVVDEIITIFNRYVSDTTIITDNFDTPCPWASMPTNEDFSFMDIQGRSRIISVFTTTKETFEQIPNAYLLLPFNDNSTEIYGTVQFYNLLSVYPWIETATLRDEALQDLAQLKIVYTELLNSSNNDLKSIIASQLDRYNIAMSVVSKMYAISIFRHFGDKNNVPLIEPQTVDKIIFDLTDKYNVSITEIEQNEELEQARVWAFEKNQAAQQLSFQQNSGQQV